MTTPATNTPTAANDNRPPEFDAELVRCVPFLRKMAARFEPDESRRDDLVADTIENALRNWTSYKSEFSLASWLVYRMRTERSNWRKKRSNQEYPLGSAFEIFGGVQEPSQEDITYANQVLAALPERYRVEMTMVAAGHDMVEIGKLFGITREAIRQRVEKARGSLRKVAA